MKIPTSEVYRKLGHEIILGKARRATLGEVIDTMEYGEIAVQNSPKDSPMEDEFCVYIFYDEDGLLKSGQGNIPVITCAEKTYYYIISCVTEGEED